MSKKFKFLLFYFFKKQIKTNFTNMENFLFSTSSKLLIPKILSFHTSLKNKNARKLLRQFASLARSNPINELVLTNKQNFKFNVTSYNLYQVATVHNNLAHYLYCVGLSAGLIKIFSSNSMSNVSVFFNKIVLNYYLKNSKQNDVGVVCDRYFYFLQPLPALTVYSSSKILLKNRYFYHGSRNFSCGPLTPGLEPDANSFNYPLIQFSDTYSVVDEYAFLTAISHLYFAGRNKQIKNLKQAIFNRYLIYLLLQRLL
mmetsp:Transcript_13858/g.26044  ORF Transcript_13858/g.26044 Transcript_13858/m.26044 type:complete len:256 (+) Transcript_13858:1095-1862(+)